jgi:hypothetical protein
MGHRPRLRLGRHRLDDPARRGGRRVPAWRAAQQQGNRAASPRCEGKPAGCCQIKACLADFADDSPHAAARKGLLGRPQHVAGFRGRNHDEPFGMKAEIVEPGSIRRPALMERHVLGDPDHRTGRSGGKQERKAAGRGNFSLPRGGNFVEDATLKSAAEHGIDRRDPERNQGWALTPAFGHQGTAKVGQNRRFIRRRRR